MKKLLVVTALAGCVFIYACGGGENKSEAKATEQATEAKTDPSYDPEIGQGNFKHVDIPAGLDASMAASGQKVYDVKCSGCHKLTNEKLVGPGWREVTTRHKPEWIMNFVTNTEEMLSKDPKAQAQLEICMVRMPKQGLTDDDARHVYEFMRKNDGIK